PVREHEPGLKILPFKLPSGFLLATSGHCTAMEVSFYFSTKWSCRKSQGVAVQCFGCCHRLSYRYSCRSVRTGFLSADRIVCKPVDGRVMSNIAIIVAAKTCQPTSILYS